MSPIVVRRLFPLLGFAIPLIGRAQEPALTLPSTLRARAIVQQGIDAMGGVPALQSIETIMRDLRGDRSDPGQQLTPLSAGSKPAVLNHPHVISARDHRRLRAVEFLHDTIKGGQPLVRRTAISGGNGVTVYYDYIWQSWRPMNPQIVPNVRARLFRSWPEGLLLAAANRVESLRWLGDAVDRGRPQQLVAYSDIDGAQITLYFDARTHFLTRSETVGDDGVSGDVTFATYYDDWRPVGTKGLKLPFRSQERVGGVLLQELRADSIVVDVALSDTLFTPPDSFAKLEAPAASGVTKLSDDAYVVTSGYQSVIVLFEDHVMVLEAGGGSGMAQSTIDHVKRLAPGKPIRYVVATHAHHDHLAGIRPYVAEGTVIVTTASAKTVVERAVQAVHGLRPDALARAPRAPRFVVVDGEKRTFTDGKRTVTLYRLAPTPHVSEMLFAYLPNEKTLFVADALDIEEPGRVGTAGDDTVQLARAIESLGLDVARIVPVHGRIGTMDDLRQSLGRRGAKMADVRQ